MSYMIICMMFAIFRSKNFEKSGEYASAWKKDEDGKMGVDGPRVVVADQGQVPQGGFVTRCDSSCLSTLFLTVCLGCLVVRVLGL